MRKWVREKTGEVWLRSPGWIIDCRSRFTALRGRRLIFSHVIRSAGSPDGSLKHAANYFLMLQRTAHFKARQLGTGQASRRINDLDHQGLSIGKNGPEAFDKANFLICLDPALKSNLQILFLSPSKDLPRPVRRLNNLSGHFIFTWDASTCSLLLYMSAMAWGGASTPAPWRGLLHLSQTRLNAWIHVPKDFYLACSSHQWPAGWICSSAVPGTLLWSPWQLIKLWDCRPNGLYLSAFSFFLDYIFLP